MARGCIFEITTDTKQLGYLDEEYYYGSEEALQIQYFQNETSEEAWHKREHLVNTLKSCGATVTEIPASQFDDNLFDGATISYCITNITPEVKKTYFKERLKKAKALLENITEEEFSSFDNAGVNKQKLQDIQYALENTYGDLVYMFSKKAKTELMTMDTFIREADPTKAYSLGNIVVMH